MCIRTLHRRKGRRVEVSPGGVFVCRCCASLHQDGPPEVLDQWLLDSLPYKRAAIIATYSVDPARLVAAGVRAEVTRLHTDVDVATIRRNHPGRWPPRTWCRSAPSSAWSAHAVTGYS